MTLLPRRILPPVACTLGLFLLITAQVCSAIVPAAAEPATREGATGEPVYSLPDALPDSLPDSLPDAPTARLALVANGPVSDPHDVGESSSATGAPQTLTAPPRTGETTLPPVNKEIAREQLSADCASGKLRGKPCRIHWLPVLGQSFEFLTAQHSGNILLDSETRNDLTTKPFWSSYVYCVKQYRWDQWTDDTPFVVHNIGHPMMGAITSSIVEQNDPKGRALVYENNGNYWRSRLKAMAWSAFYSAQWKVGPISEASIGNSGYNTYYRADLGRTTNETGFQDFVITPVYGFGWNVGEDAIDRYLMPKVHARVKNRFYLTTLFWLTPAKSAANLLQWKPTYYRDKPYVAADSPAGAN